MEIVPAHISLIWRICVNSFRMDQKLWALWRHFSHRNLHVHYAYPQSSARAAAAELANEAPLPVVISSILLALNHRGFMTLTSDPDCPGQ